MVDSRFVNMIDTQLDLMGESATYRFKHGDTKAIQAMLTHDLNLTPDAFESQVPDRQLVIHIKSADVARPISGESIVIGDDTYTIQKILEHDAYAIKVAVT